MAIIVVTGVPRSGTSAMMQVLRAAGVPLFYDDAEVPPNQFNPAGFFETNATMNGDLRLVPDGHAVKCLARLPQANFGSHDPHLIIMRRDERASYQSANRMAVARTGEPLPDDGGVHRTGTLDAVRLRASGYPHTEVWYEDLLRNTANECQRVARFLGLPEDDRLSAMADAVTGRSY